MISKIATVVALCVMGAVAGCRSLNAENYRCSEAGQCPPGFACGGDGLCHSRKDAGCEGGSCRTDASDGGDAPKDMISDTRTDMASDMAGDTSGDASGSCVTDSPCTPVNRCHLGRTRCAAGGVAACDDTSTSQSAGTPCGDGMVCSDGACVPCAADMACDRPGQPCKLGKIACATGSPVCAEVGNVAPGNACGTNMVCSNGDCVTCTDGTSCTPANPCHAGKQSCAGGTPTCTDMTTAVSDGQTCGTDRVCRQGTCVDCRAGQDCVPTGQPCRVGITSCNTGTAVCNDTGNAPNGKDCDTGKVCSNGSCLVCAAGTACVPANPCHKGTLACGAGTPTCMDTSMTIDNGTSCATDKVCSAGACVDCAANRDCVPTGTTCKVGLTSCASGSSVCQMTGNAANGTSCGSGRVCSDGSCIACAAGTSCTPPSAPCHNGSLTCTGTAPTCTDLATNLTNGTTCGMNLVCSSGSCVPCTAGQVCNPSGNVCQIGQTSCMTGTQTCLVTGNVMSGTSCGPNMVCNGGQCMACTAGTSCTPSSGVCHVGSQVCSSGAPVCMDTGGLVMNGTVCGPNLVCNGGACMSCTAAMSCMPANPCHVGTTVCSTGTMTCNDTGANAANGTMCNTNLACAGGSCTCTQGTSCMPSNPCQTGTTSCTTGVSVCNATGTAANGTTCAPGKMCMSGTCVLNPGCPGDNSPALDCPCASNGSPACNGAHQPVKLRCTGGVWVDNGTCTAGNNCDQSDGQCHAIIPQCQTGTMFCSDGNTQQTCNADWTSTVPTNCVGVCSSNKCQPAVCGDHKVEASLSEECDDGNATADDGCESTCKRSTVIGLTAGASHTCALLGSGNVRCWGDNTMGQLGIGNADFKGTTPPSMIPSISLGAQATAIVAGADHTCALLTGGTVRCWGKNNHGQHGQGDAITTRLSPAPALTFPSPATKIAAGNDTTCVVLQSGAVHCWGGNTSGMLGKATTTDICAAAGATCLSAVAIGASASAISVGSNAVCVVLSSGGITCWGGNSFGELGRSDTMVIGDTETPAAAPAPATPVVPAGRSATLLAAGSGHTCARLDNGQMECWGLNTAGQLALGLSSATFAIGDNESPSTNGVTQLMTVSALFASNTSSCAKLVAGGIRCWGNNNKGQLGYPDTNNKGGDTATIPSNLANVNFGASLTATTMALGASHACALLSNGEVRCWGRDNVGQLGNAMTLSGTMDFIGGANMTPDTVAAVPVFPP